MDDQQRGWPGPQPGQPGQPGWPGAGPGPGGAGAQGGPGASGPQWPGADAPRAYPPPAGSPTGHQIPPPPPGQAPGGYPPGPPPPAYPPGPPAPQGPGGNGRKAALAVGAAVVVGALVAGGIWYAVSRDSDASGSASSNSAAASGTPTASPSRDKPTASPTPAGSGSPTAPAVPDAPTAPSGQPNAGGCATETPTSSPMAFPSPPMTIDPSGSYTMTLKTNCGTIAFRLDAAKAPTTVNSFAFLSSKGYFDHSPCHRLTTQGIYVLQCGDPTGTGAGGPGYRFPDENLAGATYPKGTLAMANAGPDTNGSQFFIVWNDTRLPPNYTPFGTVTDGMDVVERIAAAGVKDGTTDGAPRAGVVVDTLTVAKQ